MRAFSLLLLLTALAGCTAPRIAEPSLAPRAAEAIDPRVPIPSEPIVGPADPALAQELDRLLGEVRQGAVAFDAAAAETGRLVAAAGAQQSESWVVAQQSLSALVAVRAPVTGALAEIDALGAAQIQAGGIAPGDLAAIRAAAEEAGAVSQRQAETIDRFQATLAG